MDNDIIQAYLWREVIRLGFTPISTKDINNWIHQYSKSLKDFWGLQEYPARSDGDEVIISNSLLMIEYILRKQIDAIRYSVSLYYLSDTLELMWTHDVDLQYFSFPENSLLNKYGKIKRAKRKINSRHIEAVLNGLLFHPATHQHFKSPIDNHEIRIGGGIYNPFVFLFHMRYQLCPDEEKRRKEKERLINLFENSIRNNIAITISSLFG